MGADAISVGAVRVERLIDGTGTEWAPRILSGQPIPDAWRVYEPRYFAPLGQWDLPLATTLLRHGDTVALIDLGLGPVSSGAYRAGLLLDALAAAGVSAADVTDVVFTHLHSDHIGWTSVDGEVTFPGATHHAHRADWDHFVTDGPDRAGYRSVLEPARDRFAFFDTDVALLPWLSVHPAPGHTPGSTVVRVASDADELLLLGDVVHSPAQLEASGWGVIWDDDPALAAASRARWVDIAVERGAIVTAAHFPSAEPFGRLLAAGGGVSYVPVPPLSS